MKPKVTNSILALTGLFLILAPMFTRATAQLTTLPYWDFDPLIFEPSMVGIGPAGSLACDVLILMGAALCLFATVRLPGNRLWLITAALVAIGCVPIIYHGWLSPWATIQQQRIGASWASGMFAALALTRLCRHDGYRATVFAVILGFVVVLALKGAHQMLLEHPETVADFNRNKDQIFAAQGWTPDSSMAKGYQRRLMQNEASGWFGLSNVYATYAALGVTGFAGTLVAFVLAKREPRAQIRGVQHEPVTSRGPLIAATAGLLASAAAVGMAQSKGGFAVTLLGLGLLALIVIVHTRKPRFLCSLFTPRSSRFLLQTLPIVLTLVPLASVVARGVIGERLGELSLLFRWFYMQGATRIALGYQLDGVHVGNWLLGTGPDGFKDAYLIAKIPLSPEEITSPHSILFDWWADLGVSGLLWCLVLFIWLWQIGRNLAATRRDDLVLAAGAAPSTSASPARPYIYLSVAVIVAATFASILLHRLVLTPSIAVVYAGGMLAWCMVAGHLVAGMLALSAAVWRFALAPAAVVLAAHSQFEVTASLSASAGLVLVMLAAAAAPADDSSTPMWATRATKFLAFVGGAVMVVLSGSLLVRGVLPAAWWERSLRSAAETLQPITQVRTTLASVAGADASQRRRLIIDAADLLSRALGTSVQPEPQAIDAAQRRLEAQAVPAALRALDPVLDQLDWRTYRERTRLALTFELDLPAVSPYLPVAPLIFRPEFTGRSGPPPWAGSLSAWQATLFRSRRTPLEHQSYPGQFEIVSLLESLKHDPYNLNVAWRLLEAQHAAQGGEATSEAARRVIRLDDLNRLDATRRLSPRQRALAEKLAQGARVEPPAGQ